MKSRRTTLRALREALPVLWGELDPFTRRKFASSLFMMIVLSALAAFPPLVMKAVIDNFNEPASQKGYWLTPTLLIGGFVLSQFAIRCLGEVRSLIHSAAQQRLQRRLSVRLFTHILRLPLRLHLNRQSGGVSQTLLQGLAGFQTLLQHLLYTIMPAAIELLTITIIMTQLGHPVYLWILVTSAVLFLAAFLLGAARIVEPARATNAAYTEAYATLTDSLLNYETVKYFSSEAVISERYEGAVSKVEIHTQRVARTRMLNALLTALIFGASLGVALVYAGAEVVAGTMTVGTFVLVSTYVARLMQPLETVGSALRDLSQAVVNFEKALDILREAPEVDNAEASRTSEVRGELEFENVNFAYLSDQPVLRDVSLMVPAGKMLAVVGLSGSGKSTLIRLLFRLFTLDGGRILLDGTDIKEFSLSQLRGAIAVVPQDTILFNDTIAYNIGFGRPGSSQEEIEQAARLAHLHDFIERLPQGYNTRVGERGLRLSGGERQRIAIARAAIKQPRIFVFDEATSSLDSRTERKILHDLQDLMHSSTTLVIAHRLSTIVRADEIVVLDQGVIVERGAHAELVERNGHYAGLWRAQQHLKPVLTSDNASAA